MTSEDFNIQEMYAHLEGVLSRGEYGNAYYMETSDSAVDDVLMDFDEYVMSAYESGMPPWAEAFTQVFDWQFATFHEGPATYYENFYGQNPPDAITRTARFLEENGYEDIYDIFTLPLDSDDEGMRDNAKDRLRRIFDWMQENERPVWDFYVAILEGHKAELLDVR